MREELQRFDPDLPVEEARTPPASWYLSPDVYAAERDRVLRASWQLVGRGDQVALPGQHFAAELAADPFVVARGGDGVLRGLSNVCLHHGALLVSGEGRAGGLECPYHGWTYGLDGRLVSAPRSGGMACFERESFRLANHPAAEIGPLVFLHLGGGDERGPEQHEPVWTRLAETGWERLAFVARRRHEVACNWKVFVDNYLDGGYHVPVLHPALAGQLDLEGYETELFERASIQSCAGARAAAADGDFPERVGERALYAFLYPNAMINRYGPWMDVNWVVPLAVDRTEVVFDYFLDPAIEATDEFVAASLAASDRVQDEDRRICESVQRGLASGRYDRGRYAPRLEQAMHHFHRLLAADLSD